MTLVICESVFGASERTGSNGAFYNGRTLILHRNDQILHDVVLTLRRILAHVEAEDARSVWFIGKLHLAQTHAFTDELLEFRWADFTQTFEASDLGFSAELR